jgi:DNA-binding NtrC family response regulator
MTGTRILVLASDAQLRATLARWLSSAGYGVELAEGMRRTRGILADREIALAIIAPTGLATAVGADPNVRGPAVSAT